MHEGKCAIDLKNLCNWIFFEFPSLFTLLPWSQDSLTGQSCRFTGEYPVTAKHKQTPRLPMSAVATSGSAGSGSAGSGSGSGMASQVEERSVPPKSSKKTPRKTSSSSSQDSFRSAKDETVLIPEDRVRELKTRIDSHLKHSDITAKIKDIVDFSKGFDASIGPGSMPSKNWAAGESLIQKEDKIKSVLQQQGIIDDIVSNLSATNLQGRESGKSLSKDAVPLKTSLDLSKLNPRKKYLSLTFLGGRSFLDDQDIKEDVSSNLCLHVRFRHQRFKSGITANSIEPKFTDQFLFELQSEESLFLMEPRAYLEMNEFIHIVVTRISADDEISIIGVHELEWRHVLCRGYVQKLIELHGIGAESRLPVGLLDVRLEFYPKSDQWVGESEIKNQLSKELHYETEANRLFFVYAKQWWRDFLQIRAENQHRLIKIFAQDENGMNKAVNSFIHPIRSRLIESPRHASRFVSLIPYEKCIPVGGGRLDMWKSLHAFLSQGKGDCEDHALLLCSLLLGFGLDAYVCVGLDKKDAAHMWVMTISVKQVTFWESITGARFIHEKSNTHHLKSIGCVFNANSFYANCQIDDWVSHCDFDLHNGANWKQMSGDALESVRRKRQISFPLIHNPVVPFAVETQLELELKQRIVHYREEFGLTCQWDEELSHILGQALSAYEMEKIGGAMMSNDDFQHSIRRYIPEGHTFKGYPIHYNSTQSRRVFSVMLKSETCRGILLTRGDQIRFSVRTKIVPFAESAVAVWLMLAVRYRSVTIV